MTDTKIPLNTGKPDDGYAATGQDQQLTAATFSRFVLPFAYKIEATQGSDEQKLFYAINKKNNLSFIKRRKYFTRETALTLYERAIWLDMSEAWQETPWGKEEITIKLKTGTFKIGMLPPRIILFEAITNKLKNKLEALSNEPQNILHTGFLSVDLYFPKQNITPELDDLLMLNEYFRYFGMPYDDHEKRFKESFGNVPTNYSITEPTSKINDLEKLECYFERWANLLEIPVKEGDKYYTLFPDSWAENARKLSYNQEPANHDKNWQIYADNRSYVWTAALLKNGGKTLQKNFPVEESTLEAKNYGHWIKLLNVDNPDFSSSMNTHTKITKFERDWTDERTYKRWQHDGTWYGYCYHSGVVLAPPEYVFAPFSSYYFDTTLLLFYIRMNLFRFSKELTDTFHHDNQDETWRENLRELRKMFSKFTVLYQFPLLSNQQQSIEMFELNRKYFDIDGFFKEIQHEIDNTHDFLESVEANKLGTAANKLARWGIPLAAGGLVAGIFGMNNFNLSKIFDSAFQPNIDYTIEIALVGIALAIPALVWWWKKKGDKK